MKPVPSAKQVVRKNSEPFMNSLSRTSSIGERSLDGSCSERHSFSDFGQESSIMVGTFILSNISCSLLLDQMKYIYIYICR